MVGFYRLVLSNCRNSRRRFSGDKRDVTYIHGSNIARAGINSDNNAVDPRAPRTCLYNWDALKPTQMTNSRYHDSKESVKYTDHNHDFPLSKIESRVEQLGSTDGNSRYKTSEQPGIKSWSSWKKLFLSFKVHMEFYKANLDSCDLPSNLTKIGFKSSIFQPV